MCQIWVDVRDTRKSDIQLSRHIDADLIYFQPDFDNLMPARGSLECTTFLTDSRMHSVKRRAFDAHSSYVQDRQLKIDLRLATGATNRDSAENLVSWEVCFRIAVDFSQQAVMARA